MSGFRFQHDVQDSRGGDVSIGFPMIKTGEDTRPADGKGIQRTPETHLPHRSKRSAKAENLAPLSAWLPALALFSFAMPSQAEPSDFQFSRELHPPAALVFDIGAVALDEAVLGHTENSYANLRVFRDEDLEIPMLVRPRRALKQTVSEYDIRANRSNFEVLADNRIQFTLSTTNRGDKPLEIVFRSPQKNFEKLVTVMGSSSRGEWKTLVDQEPIFDYSRFMDVRNMRVRIPESSYRHYRVELANISEEQQSPLTQIVKDSRNGTMFSKVKTSSFLREEFRIENVTLRGKKKKVGKSSIIIREYRAAGFRSAQDEKKKQTILSFDTARAPLTEIIVHTENVNFIRGYTLEARHDANASWQYLARGKLSRIRAGRFNQSRMSIALPGPKRYAHYRLTVSNQDNPPLDFSGVTVRGETHEALFFSEQGTSYRLCYGAAGMHVPVYDIGEVLKKVETAETATFELGEPRETEGFDVADKESWINNRNLLVAVVIAVAILLACLIAGAVKRVDTVKGE